MTLYRLTIESARDPVVRYQNIWAKDELSAIKEVQKQFPPQEYFCQIYKRNGFIQR